MHFKEINSLLRVRLSPEEYKLENEYYGLEYGGKNSNNVIKKVMLTLDLNLEAIHFATLNKVNFIISYRGLIGNPINNFNKYLVNKLSLLSKIFDKKLTVKNPTKTLTKISQFKTSHRVVYKSR